MAVNKTGQPADQIKGRQAVHKTQKITNNDLAELQLQSMHIRYSQAHKPFSQCLPVPVPFQKNSITNGNDKIPHDVCSRGQILTEYPSSTENNVEQLVYGQNCQKINRPG